MKTMLLAFGLLLVPNIGHSNPTDVIYSELLGDSQGYAKGDILDVFEKITPYELLGVGINEPLDNIRKVKWKLIHEHWPNKYAFESPDHIAHTKVSYLINVAYQKIKEARGLGSETNVNEYPTTEEDFAIILLEDKSQVSKGIIVRATIVTNVITDLYNEIEGNCAGTLGTLIDTEA